MPILKRTLIIMLPLGLAVMTHVRSTLWGNVKAQAEVWAQINPESARAQANAAQIEMQTGHPQTAIRRLQALLAAKPDEVQLAINLLGARCMTGGVNKRDLDMALHGMQHTANPGALLVHWFDRMLPVAMNGECPGLTSQTLVDLLNAGLKNPKLADAGRHQDLIYLLGRVSLAQGRPDAAMCDFTRALDVQVRPSMALKAAATLGAAGHPRQGLSLLNHYQKVHNETMPPTIGMPMLHDWVLARENYWPHELAHLRHQLMLDAGSQSINTEHSTQTLDSCP
jgi:tetratricopeptide (TPR) repeat protein